MSNYQIPQLPLCFDVESNAILKKTAAARSALAEMKGSANTDSFHLLQNVSKL